VSFLFVCFNTLGISDPVEGSTLEHIVSSRRSPVFLRKLHPSRHVSKHCFFVTKHASRPLPPSVTLAPLTVFRGKEAPAFGPSS
jgi:hypothetical protein